MKRLILTCALLACAVAAPAFAGSSTAGTSAGAATSGAGSSASSKTTSPEEKIVRQARDDAASFAASDGRIRGAQLESALRYLREHHAAAQSCRLHPSVGEREHGQQRQQPQYARVSEANVEGHCPLSRPPPERGEGPCVHGYGSVRLHMGSAILSALA